MIKHCTPCKGWWQLLYIGYKAFFSSKICGYKKISNGKRRQNISRYENCCLLPCRGTQRYLLITGQVREVQAFRIRLKTLQIWLLVQNIHSIHNFSFQALSRMVCPRSEKQGMGRLHLTSHFYQRSTCCVSALHTTENQIFSGSCIYILHSILYCFVLYIFLFISPDIYCIYV